MASNAISMGMPCRERSARSDRMHSLSRDYVLSDRNLECAMLMALLEECMKGNKDHPRREECEEMYESLVKQIAEQLDGGAIH